MPPATSRTEEGDWIARRFFSPADLELEPEEYVARHAHSLGNFSFHLFHYQDSALGAWVRRVGELLATADGVERCRERLLTAEQRAEAQRLGDEGL